MNLFGKERTVEECEEEAKQILDEAVHTYQPTKIFGMFSGGHDSLSCCHIASQHQLFAGVAHINTGIGIERTRQYVRETAHGLGWSLREMRSPITYESLVLRYGFPGPAGHGMMYTRLKERCIRQLVRENKTSRKDRIMLVAGMRYAESTRRMGNAEPHHREGCRVWCSPIVHWSTEERNSYIQEKDLPRNPVVDVLCMSGECLCGAFAKPGERLEIREAFPDADRHIAAIEAQAKRAGVHCVWGTRPPRKEAASGEPPLFSLCWSCGQKEMA